MHDDVILGFLLKKEWWIINTMDMHEHWRHPMLPLPFVLVS
jgi:hypothetical protein